MLPALKARYKLNPAMYEYEHMQLRWIIRRDVERVLATFLSCIRGAPSTRLRTVSYLRVRSRLALLILDRFPCWRERVWRGLRYAFSNWSWPWPHKAQTDNRLLRP